MSTPSHQTHDQRRSAAERRYVRAALVAAGALALIAVGAFAGTGWLTSHFELRAVFASANDLQRGSAVRIAGVDVGQVSAITPGPDNTSIVAMDINGSGQPIHSDAFLAIEPRLALEGNFYVKLDPGSAGEPLVRPGGLLPESNTSVPVQLDQVLDTFDLATRDALQQSIRGIADGLGRGGSASVRRPSLPTGYAGLRDAAEALDSALPSVTQVANDARGTEPGDLHGAVTFSRDFTAQLAQNPAALAGLVTNFNTVTAALSAEDQQLGASIQGLDAVARAAPPSLTALDTALPTLTNFADRLDPVLRAAPSPLQKVTALTSQVRALVQPPKLPALLDQLAPITAALPGLEAGLGKLLPLVTTADRCLSGHVVWALDQKLQDGPFSTGDPVWLDALHAFTGTTSVNGGFDGNGSAIRAGVGEGGSTLTAVLPGIGQFAGIFPAFAGVRPRWLGYGVSPPYLPDKWCDQQPLPNLAATTGPAPAWERTAAPVGSTGTP